jgi:hypothetical protein
MPLKEGLTKFVKPVSPCYVDSIIGYSVLFPFTYANGELDISYAGNSFEADMVDTSGQAPGSESRPAVRILGSPRLVTSLGENFKAYIRAWRIDSIDAGSPIEIYVAPHVIRVQESDIINVSAVDNSYAISQSAPSGDNYITGSSSDRYRTKYIFKTPLTFTIVESGVTQYITFRTNFDQEE